MSSTRAIRLDDAADLARLLTTDREVMEPVEPLRPEAFFTEAGQRDRLSRELGEQGQGVTVPLGILDAVGTLVGQVTLFHLVRGPMESGSVGYWLSSSAQGRGLATQALQEACALAFGELHLHRLQAGTLLTNVRSQAVLRRVGFEQIGVARSSIRIAGRWQDQLLHQLVAP